MDVLAKALIALEAETAREAAGVPFSPVASRATTVDWASEITKLMERGKSSTLDLARTVHFAKTSMNYGQWSELWAEWAQCRMPFCKSTADMLDVVGREFGKLDSQTFGKLPAGWSILYELARLRRTDLETLINEGKIHPALKLAEAKRLVARFKGLAAAKSPRPNAKLRLRHFKDFVHQTSSDWSAADRDLIRAELFQLALDLKDSSEPLHLVNRLFPNSPSFAAGSANN